MTGTHHENILPKPNVVNKRCFKHFYALCNYMYIHDDQIKQQHRTIRNQFDPRPVFPGVSTLYRKPLSLRGIKADLYLQTPGLTSSIPRGKNTISPVRRCRSCDPQLYDHLFASKLRCTFPVTNYWTRSDPRSNKINPFRGKLFRQIRAIKVFERARDSSEEFQVASRQTLREVWRGQHYFNQRNDRCLQCTSVLP